MNYKNLPDYREKQKILYVDKTSAKDLSVLGDNYLSKGRISDALESYQKASYTEGLYRIKEIAESTGDVMLFQMALKSLQQAATNEEWDRIGQQALAAGKHFFARNAFEKSGNKAKQELLAGLLKDKESDTVS